MDKYSHFGDSSVMFLESFYVPSNFDTYHCGAVRSRGKGLCNQKVYLAGTRCKYHTYSRTILDRCKGFGKNGNPCNKIVVGEYYCHYHR